MYHRVNPNGVGCVCPDQKVSISTRTSDPLKYMCDGNLGKFAIFLYKYLKYVI